MKEEKKIPKSEQEAKIRFLNLLLDMIIKYGPEVLAEASMENSGDGGKE